MIAIKKVSLGKVLKLTFVVEKIICGVHPFPESTLRTPGVLLLTLIHQQEEGEEQRH